MKTFKTRLAAVASGIALALASPALAQTEAATEATAPAVEASGHPALWKVADEDTTIYLFGTVHLLPDGVNWYSGDVKTALSTADELVTEIDMSPEAMAGMQSMVMKMAMLPEGTTLRSLMNEEQRATYEAGLARFGLPAAALDPFEPWMAALQLANIAYAKAGLTPDKGVELNLASKLKEGAGRDALETVEFQLGIFDTLPQDAQLEYLLETIDQFEEVGPMLQKVVEEWSVGDVAAVAELVNEPLEEEPVLADRLLYQRNSNWAKWIDKRLDRPGVVFMAVGAGHLAGTKSVQDALEAEGIEIVRVQ